MSVNLPSLIYISEPPDNLLAGDGFFTNNPQPGDTSFKIEFESAIHAEGFSQCVDIGGCSLSEDGTVQYLGTVTWSDGSVDSISFQGDVDPVPTPEPSSLILLASALILVAGVRRNMSARAFGLL